MMKKKLIVTTITALFLLGTSIAFAANFKTGMMGITEAKQLKNGGKMLSTAPNQLFICNQTNLPSQTGAPIQVSFPQAGVSDQLPAVNQCAYLSTDSGTFTTPVTIFAPANSGNSVYNNNMSSGQMWGVSYNSTNNTFTVFQMQ